MVKVSVQGLLCVLLASCGVWQGDGEALDLAVEVADEASCVPACDGAMCGLDGCGGVCGVCARGTTCLQRLCVQDQIEIPEGRFVRGCLPEDDPLCSEVERPQRVLDLARFRVDLLEVSVEAYRACVLAGECTEPGSGDYCNWGDAQRVYHPVNCVTWFQAAQYCRWAGKRLCSEAEWEKAARGTEGTTYPWGDAEPGCDLAAFGGPEGVCGDSSTAEVGTHQAGRGPFGVLDASGNVWEWVSDWYDGSWYDQATPIGGPQFGEFKVVRGGSFASEPVELRASHRWAQRPDQASVGLGIRCCGP